MADAIRKEFQVEPVLVRSSGGIFDVEVDGQLIFSKHQQGRFPSVEEVLEKIRALSS